MWDLQGVERRRVPPASWGRRPRVGGLTAPARTARCAAPAFPARTPGRCSRRARRPGRAEPRRTVDPGGRASRPARVPQPPRLRQQHPARRSSRRRLRPRRRGTCSSRGSRAARASRRRGPGRRDLLHVVPAVRRVEIRDTLLRLSSRACAALSVLPVRPRAGLEPAT